MTKAIRVKNETFGMLQQMVAAFEKITGKTVKVLRTDYSGEYRSKECLAWLTYQDTILRPTVAERFNRTIMIICNQGQRQHHAQKPVGITPRSVRTAFPTKHSTVRHLWRPPHQKSAPAIPPLRLTRIHVRGAPRAVEARVFCSGLPQRSGYENRQDSSLCKNLPGWSAPRLHHTLR